jgi:O-antigen/teichoic acid export membrane protein
MSTASRLISGSAASWMRMGITMISQIALVPLYLNHWSVETYGVWLAIQALVAIMTMLDLGHQTFLGYEFLRLGRTNMLEFSRNLWSGVSIGIAIGILQIMVILLFIYTGVLPHLLGRSDLHDVALTEAAGTVLLLQGIVWLIASSMGGLFVRALESFGYYPRLAWWGVFITLVINLAPAIAVAFGADLLMTGIVTATATILINTPLYVDMFNLMHKEKIKFCLPSLKLGYKNFLRSTAIAGKLLLENARQQGVRLVLAPLSGAAGMAAFSTMRTGSNVALQGLNTITNPLMPDLMRFLHQRDQVRSEAAFGTVWIVVVALMAPAVVILQAFIAPLFDLWTNSQIEFDPGLFAILSLSVLVYAVVQPAMAVVLGNNLMKPQLLLSIAAAIIVIGGIMVMVPWIGILGAGIALLAAEIAASIGYTIVAQKWLAQNSLTWPKKSFWIAATSVGIAGVTMGSMTLIPAAKWLIFACSMILLGWNFWRYWKVLPDIVTQRAVHIIRNLPGIKKIVFFRQS